MVMLDNLSLATVITQSDVESDGDEPQVLQVVPAPPVRSGEGDDEVEPSLKRHRQVNKNEKGRKKAHHTVYASTDKLEKEYRSKRAKERVISGQEPHKSIDENELERLLEV
ncbi:hypothetical protein GN958_ATG20589 [Phytophthora infestans]|uniref:Uncharacterized protein n=1 Tax=Phytophthora infestans TaxID=4787 RepID=A0A8S9TUH0_PHYIN|nr:hypothetical protein GN958_ATG20589 [Phytophthora infestans]